MNIYFDTEFTGLIPGTTLISIGMISEDEKQFYAEFTDYDRSLCDEWIKENVLNNLILKNPSDGKSGIDAIWDNDLKAAGIEYGEEDVFVRGSKNYIRDKLKEWLEEFRERVQLVSDCCHYDMVLFCNLFGGAFNIPDNVNPCCYDINMDIANYFSDDTCGIYYNCESLTMNSAFDVSREQFVIRYLRRELPEGVKHNSLYDAKIIKQIYEGLRK